MAKKRGTANAVDRSVVGEMLAPRPTFIEPPRLRVDAAMKAFPDAMSRTHLIGRRKPSEGAVPEYHATLSLMAGVLSGHVWDCGPTTGGFRWRGSEKTNFSESEAAWAVYRLAKLGLLVAGSDEAINGELFWWTTPALWDWWRNAATPSGDDTEPKRTTGVDNVPPETQQPASVQPVAKAPKGTPGRKPNEKKQRHAEYTNELRSQTPPMIWKECAAAVNEKFSLTGDDKYNERSVKSPWRVHFGDKSKTK